MLYIAFLRPLMLHSGYPMSSNLLRQTGAGARLKIETLVREISLPYSFYTHKMSLRTLHMTPPSLATNLRTFPP